MAMSIDRYYDCITDLVPPELRARLDETRSAIARHIDQEVDAFAADLTRAIAQQLAQAEQAMASELAARRAELDLLVQELRRQIGEANAPAAATAQRLLAAQAAFEERWRTYGRNLRQILVTGLQTAGLPVPGLATIAGLMEDGKPA